MAEKETIQKVMQSNTADFSSFNVYAKVTLKSGQNADIQATQRHGLDAKKMLEDLNEFIAFLNGASEVEPSIVFFCRDDKQAAQVAAAPTAEQSGVSWRKKNGVLDTDKGKLHLLVPAGVKEPESIECPLHQGKLLKRFDKGKGSWLSHKDGDGWCNGNFEHEATTDNYPEDPPF